jgi:hypothetical protein
MKRRFLNVEYKGIKAEINVEGLERMDQVHEKVRVAFPQSTVCYPQIQFYNKDDKQVDVLDDIPAAYYTEGGLELKIRLLPLPTSSRQSSEIKRSLSLITHYYQPVRKKWMEIRLNLL